MFDCGMHMGFTDERRFPDFTVLSPTGSSLTGVIDVVIVTHFHLDHCGALPYLTEQCGYRGPVIMTYPTKALCPILLEDFRKIAVEKKGETNFFTSNMIKECIGRVKPVLVGETVTIGDDVEVRAYYAGHVLGAAMFYVRVNGESVLYTGDYNMTPDRHLGAASVELHLKPDVLITESTYATTLRDSKRAREREFLRNIHQCIAEGGKVLIPTFALGRVQELCILVEDYWQRMGLSHIPIYFSAGMAAMANEYYRVFIDWTNEKLKADYGRRNPFAFQCVRPFEKHFAEHPGPMVLFSSPGMLHSGMSLEIFKKWCEDARNLLIIPGFCVSGTVGAKLLEGQRRIVVEEGNNATRVLNVKMQVKNMSFSAHADARGIMQLIRMCEPRNVVLVHGEAGKMAVLKGQIIREMGVPCFDPPNGQVLNLESSWDVPIRIDGQRIMKERYERIERLADIEGLDEEELLKLIAARASNKIPAEGTVKWTADNVADNEPPEFVIEDSTHEELTGMVIKSTFGRSLGDAASLCRELQRILMTETLLSCENSIVSAKSIRIDCTTGEIVFNLADFKVAVECVNYIQTRLAIES